jgi:hypothetical protein
VKNSSTAWQQDAFEKRLSMTTVENLLTRKQKLLERLQDNPGSKERDEIEGELAQINTALDLLEVSWQVKP